MSTMQINSVLAQIRSLQQQTRIAGPAQEGGPASPAAVAGANGLGAAPAGQPVSFAQVLKGGLDGVNAAQSRANRMADAFERGVPGVELAQVMLESQKASVQFRAAVEVRNRLVTAYQEIMNMPI
ncbi:MAG: hypothetical protein RL026_761 [Pseudomonadota bacterium]|jgi:flagellar hook-basal body complex protein FliE